MYTTCAPYTDMYQIYQLELRQCEPNVSRKKELPSTQYHQTGKAAVTSPVVHPAR